MAHIGNEPQLTKDNREKPVTNRRRAIVWVLVAFGFLIAGLAGGTILLAWKREWAWVFPVASFIGYLLAFRRGLLLWNPKLDRTWRRYLWLEGEMVTGDEEASPAPGEDQGETLGIVRPETPPTRHELRLIR